MAKNAESDIRALVENFVGQLTTLVRQSAVESVQAALLGGAAPAAPARRGRKPGRKPGPKPGKKTAKKGGRRARRSPAEIEAAKAKIVSHVKANPGAAMGELSKALGMDAITIRAQVNDLLKARSLRKEGERRGTRYFAGAGGGGQKKATKRGKKAAGRGKGSRGKRATKKKTTKRKTAKKGA